MTSRWRQWIKRFHPEGIPWPASCVYNAVSRSDIFRRHYALVAQDIAQCATPKRILDIGTGPGQLLLALRQALPRAELVGVDISAAMVAQARRNISAAGQARNIRLKVAGAAALPFADQTFDCVTSTGSLHHWKNPLTGLSEAFRVLENDGACLVYDLVREMPRAVSDDVRNRFGRLRWTLLWLHSFEEPFLSPGQMERLGHTSTFGMAETRFVGALCCLAMKRSV